MSRVAKTSILALFNDFLCQMNPLVFVVFPFHWKSHSSKRIFVPFIKNYEAQGAKDTKQESQYSKIGAFDGLCPSKCRALPFNECDQLFQLMWLSVEWAHDLEFHYWAHSFISALVLLWPLECQKSLKAAYVRTYFITLPLNLSFASLVAAVVFYSFAWQQQNCYRMHSLEMLNGRSLLCKGLSSAAWASC